MLFKEFNKSLLFLSFSFYNSLSLSLFCFFFLSLFPSFLWPLSHFRLSFLRLIQSIPSQYFLPLFFFSIQQTQLKLKKKEKWFFRIRLLASFLCVLYYES
ncbi:hypothetical protein BD560DRAFT_222794 [Blakeslea trispora]|nr:hypothetical protein BD560DRAFT_222794 [Blakeslea trispora]